jgi:hypothetical protein
LSAIDRSFDASETVQLDRNKIDRSIDASEAVELQRNKIDRSIDASEAVELQRNKIDRSIDASETVDLPEKQDRSIDRCIRNSRPPRETTQMQIQISRETEILC